MKKILFLITLWSLPILSFAQGTAGNAQQYVPLVSDLPEIITSSSSFGDYLTGWFQLILGLVTVLAVIWITLGGIKYMSTDAYSGKSEGKKMVQNAIIGLLLAGVSWLILFTINPAILNVNLNFTQQESQDFSVTTNIPTDSGSLETYYCFVWYKETFYFRNLTDPAESCFVDKKDCTKARAIKRAESVNMATSHCAEAERDSAALYKNSIQ